MQLTAFHSEAAARLPPPPAGGRGQARTQVRIINDLGGAHEDRARKRQFERIRRLQVDDQLELCWLLDRQIGRLRALTGNCLTKSDQQAVTKRRARG